MTPELVTLAEHYSIRQDEHVDDVTWLADSAARGWVALGKTSAFAGARPRRRPCAATAPRLLPTRDDLSGEVYVERIMADLEAITRACAEAGPFIYVLLPNRIERMAALARGRRGAPTRLSARPRGTSFRQRVCSDKRRRDRRGGSGRGG